MTVPACKVGAFVLGAPTSPRALVRHGDLLTAYADGAIEDEREGYLSHFAFGSEMAAHYRANRQSVAGFAGPCWCRWLVLDIDRANLVDALADACRLVRTIHQRYAALEGDVPVYFSGGKGFHILVELAHNPPPAVGFQRVARTFAKALAARAGVRIDSSIYDIAHIIRLPNTKHPRSGLFKRRIDAEALFQLDVPRILELAKHPAGDGIPAVRSPVPQLAADWAEAERQTVRTAEARAAVRRDFGPVDARAPRYFLELLRFGVDQGERHQTLFRAAAWLTEQGAPPSLCSADGTGPRCGADAGRRGPANRVRDRTRQQATGRADRSAAGSRRRRRRLRALGDSTRGRPTAVRRAGLPLRGACRRRRGAGMTPPTFTTGADLFGSWFADVERGEPPVRYALPDPFAALDVRPGRLILFGGAPGGGKTAALLQLGIDLLRLNESARLLVANVEMTPGRLVERIAARLSAVPLTAIADRTLTPDELARVRSAVASLEPIGGRLAFLNAPYSLEHLAAAGTAFGANVLILDYIQRFAVGDGSKDRREQLETAATVLRRFCDSGAAVLVASAVARQKNAGGSTYRGLNLASFRGSSELEYGADAAFLLDADEAAGIAFRCEKNHYGAVVDIVTRFDPITQTFAPAVALSGLDAFDAATPAPRGGHQPKGG
jgi:replicative DNA helicase